MNVGATYTVSGTFTDPGADAWTATVNWGDGSAPSSRDAGRPQLLADAHYTTADLYTVTVTIADDDSTTSRTHSVTVVQPTPGLGEAIRMIDQLVAERKMARDIGTCLKAQVIAAQRADRPGQQPGGEDRPEAAGVGDRLAGADPGVPGSGRGAAAGAADCRPTSRLR